MKESPPPKIGVTPSFPVEKQKERLNACHKTHFQAQKHVADLTKDIFPCAENHDTMSLLSGGVAKKSFLLWRPNNYRLKICFSGSKKASKTSSGNKRAEPTFPMTNDVKASSGNKRVASTFPMEIKVHAKGMSSLRLNARITLLIHTNCVIGIFSLKSIEGKKQWFKVEIDTLQSFSDWLDAKVKAIEDELMCEISKLGLDLDMDSKVWIRHEDGVKNEEFLDSIPANLIMHDSYFKKVYKDEVEFKSPSYVKNYLSNRAIENIAPEISSELAEIKSLLSPRVVSEESHDSSLNPQISVSLSHGFSDLLCTLCGWNEVWCGCKSPVFKSAIIEKECDLK